MLNALSIDIEEHFQVHAFEGVISRSEWDRHPSRVTANTRHVLRLLKIHNVRATFFVLGWIADRYPELVCEIARNGHEIASHGHWHELNYRQNAAEFARDLEQSLSAINSAFQSDISVPPPRIIGYRAPSFSITGESLWVLDILREHDILYDSSIFPLFAHDRYGIPSANRFINRIRNDLWEIPVSTVRWAKRNWPVAGGGYLRLLPLWVTRRAIRRINREGSPAVVYVHPWEFDPQQPRIPNTPPLARFRHYVNLNKTESRFRALLQEFQFAPICEVFASELSSS